MLSNPIVSKASFIEAFFILHSFLRIFKKDEK